MSSVVPTRTELIDMGWRMAWTAIQAFTGGMLAAGSGVVDITALEAGYIAAIGAVVSLLKTYASNKLGSGTATERESAALGLAQPVASNNATPAVGGNG